MYCYQNLERVSLRHISQCLNAAFSDYAIPIHLSEAELSQLFLASGIDRSLSFGAFFEGRMVGCMLNSRGIYQGYRAAFDMATGVVPEHRGKQVFAGLFALARQAMKQYQIQRYYLEVLQQNTPAISLYQRHGFSITREFVVFSGSASSESQLPEEIQYTAFSAFDFSAAETVSIEMNRRMNTQTACCINIRSSMMWRISKGRISQHGVCLRREPDKFCSLGGIRSRI